MVRYAGLLLLVLAGLTPGAVRAADDDMAGVWKVSLSLQGQLRPLWLMKVDRADGKYTTKMAGLGERSPDAAAANLKVTDGVVTFDLTVQDSVLNVEGRLPKAGSDRMYGSVLLGGQLATAELERTTLKSLENAGYELAKDALARGAAGSETVETAQTLLRQAAANKAKPEEVRSWADKAYRAADAHGPRYQREVALRLAETLTPQEGFAPVALEYARRAERQLTEKDKPALHRRTLGVLQTALTKAGKAEEAKEIEARLKKYDAAVAVKAFAGRKAKSDRAVLVELFTGAQCPPCVAADLAFDALGKTYKPGEVVLLQYHLHIPGPDPLTNADTVARADYYGDQVEGTPATFFNGKPEAGGGGGRDDAQEKYDEYVPIIDQLLEKTTDVRLKATAARDGEKIQISATVEAPEANDKLRLRLALVEETVAYAARNGLKEHHNVVRALPGGTAGVALKDKSLKHTATVDVAGLRKGLTKYLDDFAAEQAPFPSKERPLELKNLRVVAFVQNDRTKEVLQVVQVDVK